MNLTRFGDCKSKLIFEEAKKQADEKYKAEEAYSFSNDFAAVKKNNAWGFIDNTGNIIIPCQYSMVKDFNKRRAAVMRNNKWGFVDASGEVISDCQYDSINDFHEGYAIEG